MAKKVVEIPSLAVTSRIKDYISSKGLRSGSDIDKAVTTVIAAKLDRAIDRCKANGRQTVRSEDL